MAPAKLNTKKKRVAGGLPANPAPQGATSSPPGAGGASANGSSASAAVLGGVPETFVNKTPMTLSQAARYYGQLAHDSKRLRIRLEWSLWIFEVVAVTVVNALMYEETVEVTQIVAVVLSALWLGRLLLLRHLTNSAAPSDSKRFVALRVLLLLGFIGIFTAVHIHYIGNFERDCWTTLTVVATLDAVSIMNSVLSTHATAALKTTHAIEIVFMTGIFSTQYNHQPYLIYDRYAFFLTLGVSLAHFFVVDSTCNAVFTTMWDSESDVSQNQQQRWLALEEVHKLLDHGMVLKPATARAKNKEWKDMAALLDEDSDPSVQLSVQTHTDAKRELSRCVAAQAVVVAVQLFATSFILYSWELCSLLMCTSVALLFEVMRLRLSLERSCALPSSVDDLLAGSERSAHASNS